GSSFSTLHSTSSTITDTSPGSRSVTGAPLESSALMYRSPCCCATSRCPSTQGSPTNQRRAMQLTLANRRVVITRDILTSITCPPSREARGAVMLNGSDTVVKTRLKALATAVPNCGYNPPTSQNHICQQRR